MNKIVMSAVVLFTSLAFIVVSGCIPVRRGLVPILPSDGDKVNSLKPTLTWEPYSDKKDGRADIRYGVIIKEDTVTVESKADIHDTSYTVEHELEPGKKYNWCVYPIWTRNDHIEHDQCNSKQYFYFAVFVFGWTGGYPYTFTTPDK